MIVPLSPIDASGVEPSTLREALVRGEVRRAVVVLAVLLLLALMVILQELVGRTDMRIPVSAAVALTILFGVQVAVLLFARRAARADALIPEWFTLGTVIVEALVPTAILLAQIVNRTLEPYVALTAPPILAYSLIITLTTLRLRPGLCLLAGVVSAGSYLALLAHVRLVLDRVPPVPGLPFAAYFSVAGMILILGLACAWVAREIGRLFVAAAREAETRRRMDRIEQDIAVARTIQRALLPPRSPEVDGFEIVGWNRPADETGGDYYDWQRLPDGSWIVSLADVSGHGVGPAFVTAACRAYVRASSHFDGELDSLTSRVNQLLFDDLHEGRFVTMVSVLVDPERPSVDLLSAGHGPTLLLASASGEVREIVPEDIPLAVVRDMTFGPVQRLELAPGDVLVLITDGFFEWARTSADGARERYGVERLAQSLRRHAHKEGAALVDGLTADVEAFAAGEPQQDDLTVVVIRRTR